MRAVTGCQTTLPRSTPRMSWERKVKLAIMIEIVVNGEKRPVEEGTTVLGLLRSLDVNPERVAVEFDRAILKRPLWETTALKPGSQLEVVHFVGGG
jgi:sulfur carrier protein